MILVNEYQVMIKVVIPILMLYVNNCDIFEKTNN